MKTVSKHGRPTPLHTDLTERLIDILLNTTRARRSNRWRKYRMRQMTSRNTRPNATGGSLFEIGVGVGAVCARRHREHQIVDDPCFRGNTTPDGDGRRSGIVCASLRGKITACPNRTSSKILAMMPSECGAALLWFEYAKALRPCYFNVDEGTVFCDTAPCSAITATFLPQKILSFSRTKNVS